MNGEMSVLCTGLALTDIGAELPDTNEKFSLNMLATEEYCCGTSEDIDQKFMSAFDERELRFK